MNYLPSEGTESLSLDWFTINPMTKDTELIFPSKVIADLLHERGEAWQELLQKVQKLEEGDPHHAAFIYLMAKINGCHTCSADSFRSLRGCSECSLQNIRRHKASDEKLIKQYDKLLFELIEKTNKA